MNLPKNYNSTLSWISTSLRKYVLEEEASVINSTVTENLLKGSFAPKVSIIAESDIAFAKEFYFANHNAYKFVLFPLDGITLLDSISSVKQNTDPSTVFIVSTRDKLPIDSDSVDLVILPHTLENILNPEEVLRESHRVLRPEGKIIITGFNVLGIWSFCRLINRIFKKSSIWGCLFENNFFFVGKVIKWLNLLGFNDFKVKHCCYNLPINNKQFLQKFDFLKKFNKFLPLIIGNVYVIYGCKKTIPLIPIKSCKWNEVRLSDAELAKNILKHS